MSDVGAALRRRWPIAVAIILLVPVAVGVYLASRDVTRPAARYTTSADMLIPAYDPETGDAPDRVPPVLLQGQRELALSRNTRDLALQAAGFDPDANNNLGFDAQLNESSTIMTLSVVAMKPETAAAVLDEYIVAFEEGRRQSVLDAAVERADIEVRTIGVLVRKLSDIERQLSALGVPLPATVPDGSVVPTPLGASIETALLLYQRNAALNEMQRRHVNYSLQITLAAIPGDFTTVVQRRSTARVVPPPPSPLIPILEIIGAGLFLAVAVPVTLDRFDATITEARSAPGAFRARLLATIPYMPHRLQSEYAPPGSTWDAAFRSLAATSISTDQLPKAIMVTCPVGATQDSVAANFAVGLASLGATVALVGTVPRQGWFLQGDGGGPALGPEGGQGESGEGESAEVDVYVDVDALAAGEERPEAEPHDGEPLTGGGAPPAGTAGGETPGGGEVGAPASASETARSAVEAEAPPAPATVAAPDGPDEPVEVPTPVSFYAVPTFPELLEVAQAGRLPAELRSSLGSNDVANLYIIPPGRSECPLALDGLPPLLEALAGNEIDVVVIAGPALLEDPNSTIIAWSTRHVLWTVELGRVNTRDAQLSADRLELAGVAPFGLAVVNRHA